MPGAQSLGRIVTLKQRIAGMRAMIAALFAFSLFACGNAQAGKIFRARSAVRSETPSHELQEHDDASSHKGKLAQARHEVRPEPRPRDDRHGHRASSHRRPRRTHGAATFGFLAFDYCQPCYPPPVVETYVYSPQPVIVAPAYPETIRPAVVESFARQFAPYPYAGGCDGLMVSESPGFGKNWSGRGGFELGSDFDGFDRSAASFLVEGTSGLGLDFNWNSYTEELPGGGHDELHVGKLDLMYRIAESDRTVVRVGLGAAWLGDRDDTDWGVNFTLQADLAPADPFVVSGELDLGTLGDAQHLHAAGTVGVMLNRCEVYGGYDYRRIGDVELEGPMIGLRVWF
jgi:hypothetical protein